mmetsp:Transcript_36509/g.98836  ORF Transcript_36509/g.98836 Transcript_36509/m.98836 type:complete len:764 (-) Transcript_36509:129-2420(-)
MKFFMAAYLAICSVLLLALAPTVTGRRTAGARSAASLQTSDRTITQVVKLLQDMLDKSKADGDSVRELFGKHKCYCDDNEASKKQEIETLTKEIGLLESNIEELLSDSAVLSTEVAQLKADMEANVEARGKATAARNKENTDFVALEADLTDALSRMNDAIKVLADIGADQSMAQAAADHQKFMANYKPATLLNLKETVRQALLAASAVVRKKQPPAIEAFLQAPFTGTYTAQSGEVIGILKDMRDTFKTNLQDAQASEQAALDAYNKFTDTMNKAHADMDNLYQSKQRSLSANDDDLGTKKGLLADAERQKGEAETFLDQLLAICAQKAKEYEQRTELRTNEDAAISEAIAILNSDAAFQTFGTVTATKSGPTALFQAKSVQRHQHNPQGHDAQRRQAQALLRQAAGSSRSMVLTKVIALLAADNPFTIVLTEIKKMIDLVAAEEQADDDQFDWCKTERKTSNDKLSAKKSQITTLNGEINKLTNAIEDPQTGLKAMIQSDEDALQANTQSQQTQTKDRTDDNLAYQRDVENLVEAERLLSEAVSVLKAYYDKIAGSSLVAVSESAGPAPPSTWDGAYKGQSGHGGATAISMIEFILSNTKKEEEAAHDAERTSQSAFEDSMSMLKDEEATLQGNLVDLQKSLAEKEEELLDKKKDLKATTAEQLSIEAYLEQIKPGCDFIVTNIGERKASRKAEDGALKNAMNLLKGTPVYQTAVALEHNESLDDCLSICTGDEAHVDCRACQAHVTVPGYCAGHPGTPGC